jgi:hypothetical protein
MDAAEAAAFSEVGVSPEKYSAYIRGVAREYSPAAQSARLTWCQTPIADIFFASLELFASSS